MVFFKKNVQISAQFTQLDPKIFDFVKLDVLVLDEINSDQELLWIRDMFVAPSNFYVSSKSKCDGRDLKIIWNENQLKFEARLGFLKEQCQSLLLKDFGNIDYQIQNQPYFYQLIENQLFEVQSFAKNKKLIAHFGENGKIDYYSKDILDRRSNFNGATLVTNCDKTSTVMWLIDQNGKLRGRYLKHQN